MKLDIKIGKHSSHIVAINSSEMQILFAKALINNTVPEEIINILTDNKIIPTKGEGRKLLAQGAIKFTILLEF